MHNHVHLPMDFTEKEKPLILEYLKEFKHSELSIKMLMCAYFGGRISREAYISLDAYIKKSLKYADIRYDKDESLKRYWNFSHETNYSDFFGFSKNTILKGTVNDVEKMITDLLFYEGNNKLYTRLTNA